MPHSKIRTAVAVAAAALAVTAAAAGPAFAAGPVSQASPAHTLPIAPQPQPQPKPDCPQVVRAAVPLASSAPNTGTGPTMPKPCPGRPGAEQVAEREPAVGLAAGQAEVVGPSNSRS